MLQTSLKKQKPEEEFTRSSSGLTDNDLRIQSLIETKEEAEEVIKTFIEIKRSRAEAIAYLHALGIYLSRLN